MFQYIKGCQHHVLWERFQLALLFWIIYEKFFGCSITDDFVLTIFGFFTLSDCSANFFDSFTNFNFTNFNVKQSKAQYDSHRRKAKISALLSGNVT